jgi:hypothetical protein
MVNTEKNNQTVLIIPDLHHRWEYAERIIAAVGADVNILLGDYYDDFNDTPEMVRDTCEWLEASVEKSNRIHLVGNHDIHYMYPYRNFQSSGYEQWKYFIIRDMVPQAVWDKLAWFHILDDRWLLSHAGLQAHHVPNNISNFTGNQSEKIKRVAEWLNTTILDGLRNGATGENSWIFHAGIARYGNQRIGGIIWCDHSKEFVPSSGLWQIYGHTPQHNEPSWWIRTNGKTELVPPYKFQFSLDNIVYSPKDSYNLCLDVWKNMHYAIWDGTTMTIREYNEL